MHLLVPPVSFHFMSHFTESTHNEEQLPHCFFCCGAKKGKNKNKKHTHTQAKPVFVRLCWVQIYAPKLMALFNMKTEDNDWRRPMKATLKSSWQNQSAVELLSCSSRKNVFTLWASLLSFFSRCKHGCQHIFIKVSKWKETIATSSSWK